MLGVVALLTVLELVAVAHRLSLLTGIEQGTVSLTTARSADNGVRAAALLRLGGFMVTAGVLIAWQWRIAKNAESLGRIGARWTPGWSIGGWFIPFANFVIPYTIMQELWSSADPRGSATDWKQRPRSRLISAWWAAFLASGLIVQFSVTSGNSATATISSIRSSNRIALIGLAVNVIAAVLGMCVVHQLTVRQIELHNAATATATTRATASAGWYADPCAHFDYRFWDGTQWTDHVSREGLVSVDPIKPTSDGQSTPT
jgi:hypothetical protein